MEIKKDTIVNRRYLIRDIIGQGGMGIVYLVRDSLKANLPIALKTIKSSLVNSKSLTIFKREFEIMTRLRHPNLVNVYNFGYDPNLDCYYFTMEYLHGKNLKEMLAIRGKIPLNKAMDIILEVLRGLSFIHSRDIIYRDIKPSNIIMDKKIIKLTDFGISDIKAPDLSTFKGSPLYLAPEILKKHIDKRCDIYSLGILFFEMVTGTAMYDYSDMPLLFAILNDKKSFISAREISLKTIASPVLRRIISKMTSFNPDDRYENCTEIILDINRTFKKNYPLETRFTEESYVLGVGMTDRNKEMNVIRKRITAPENNKLFLLKGEMGSGKSRIFTEIKKYCQLRAIPFLESECYSQISKPYFAITSLLRQILLYCPEEISSGYRRHLSRLLKLRSAEYVHISNLGIEKDILIESISRFITDYGSQLKNANVLYINNLQWADEGSLEVLAETLSKVSRSVNNQLRILASARIDSLSLISGYIKGLKKAGLITINTLRPFDKKSTQEYIYNAFGKDRVDKNIFNILSLFETSLRGNPFLISELLKAMVSEKFIRRISYQWAIAGDINKLAGSATLDDIISSRVKGFLYDLKYSHILKTLSLIRIGLTIFEIQGIFPDIPKKRVREAILELETAEILRAERIEQRLIYYFAHDIIQDILEKEVKSKEKWHKGIGISFEQVFRKSLDEYAEELSYHFSNSDDKEKAVEYLIRAGKVGEAKYMGNSHILSYYKKAMDTAHSINKNHHKIPLICMYMAVVSTEEGDYKSSLSLLDRAESILKRQEGPGIDKDLSLINNYRGLLFQRQGNFADSLQYFELAYKKLIKVSSENSKDLAHYLNNTGITYLQWGKYGKATEYFRKALDIRLSLFGEKNIEVSKSYHNIGVVFLKSGDFKNALIYLKKSGKILNLLRIKDHNTAFLWNNISIVYSFLKKNRLRLKYMQKALSLRLHLLGEHHSHTAFSYIGMGVIYSEEKDYDRAIEYFERAKDIYQKRFGPYNPFTATAMSNISSCYLFKDQYDIAEKYLLKALNIRKKTLGIANYETHRTYIQLLILFKRKKDSENLKKYGNIALKLYRKQGTQEQVGQIISNLTLKQQA